MLLDTYVFLICLCLGSFYNVVAIRMLKGESFVSPPSRCPKCQHQLIWYELIPVISYIGLKGKCRSCKKKISILYPFTELLTALVLFTVWVKTGLGTELIVAFLLFSVTLLSTFTDIRERLILDKITYPAIVIMLVVRWLLPEPYSFQHYLLAGVICLFVLWGIAILSKGKLGGGDIKLMTFMSVAIGIDILYVVLFASSIGLVYSLLTIKKHGLKQEIPFAPFLLTGVWITYLYFSPVLTLG